MAQARTKTTTPVQPVRPTPTEPSPGKGSPWMTGALIGAMLALFALAGWTLFQRYERGRGENLARGAIAAWDSGKPSAFTDVYDQKAVVIASDGTKLVGLGAIESAALARGAAFSISQTGAVTVSGDGSYVTTSYRYEGDGRGTGVTILEIEGGKVVRQWNYDANAAHPSSTR